MKKLFSSVFAVSILFGGFFAFSATYASNDCKEVEFAHETVCVSIEKVRSDRFELITEHEDGTAGTLRCDIMTPDNSLRSIPQCNGEFTFDDSKSGRIKLWIRSNELAPEDWEDKPSSSSTWTFPQWMYDFSEEEWLDGNYYDDDDDTYDTDNFSLTASPSDPEEDEYVDITVRARDGSSTDESYRGTVRFKVERKSGSSRVSASSSLYTLARTSYTFTSSDDGEHDFANLVRFRNDAYDYRLVVYDDDDDDIVGYKTFYLNGDGLDSYDTDNFSLTASPSDPDEDEYVDITVQARDGSTTDTSYRGTVYFLVERKSGSSRVSASSSLYTLARTSYTFTSSDRGQKTLSNLVRFRNDAYDYRLVVYDDDDDDIVGYKTFYLYGDDDDDDDISYNFLVGTDDNSPALNQWVDLTIRARDGTSNRTSYRGTVKFDIYYSTNGSSWTKTTSSTYYEIKSTYTNGYTFVSSNNGYKSLTDLIRFKKNHAYKVVVKDNADNSIKGEKIFYVGSYTYDGDSGIAGFSSSELNTVQAMYDAWPNMIRDLKAQYSKLKNSSTWNTRSNTFYDDLTDILDNVNSRTYKTYASFYDGFLSWYRYTINIR